MENTDDDSSIANASPRKDFSPDPGKHYIDSYNAKLDSNGNSIPAVGPVASTFDDIFTSDRPFTSKLDQVEFSPEKSMVKNAVEDSSDNGQKGKSDEQKDNSDRQENESDGEKEVESGGVGEKTSSYGYVYIIIIFEAVSIVLFVISFKC